MNARPLCFVLMPFGSKPDPTGGPEIDFNRIYSEAIKPAIEAAGMEPIRADEERSGGIIHKAMFERLLLCEYAIADLTTANANVFYELGVRHTARPRSTQPIYATSQPIPFDVNLLRAMPYQLGTNNRFTATEAAALRDKLTEKLCTLRDQNLSAADIDSPLFEMLGDWKTDLSHLKTDLFLEQAKTRNQSHQQLADARELGKEGGGRQLLEEIRNQLLDDDHIDNFEAGVAVDLLLSYRALEAYDEMIALYQQLPVTLKRQVLVREQLAFAYNRRAGAAQQHPGDRRKAIKLLRELEEERGPSPENCGLLGRIYKDLWDEKRAESPLEAKAELTKAIASYRRGFEADWRDAYPGINLVTLLEIKGEPADLEERDALLPVVLYAVNQRLQRASPNYWDHATLLELAVLRSHQQDAEEHLAASLSSADESWKPGTTARNLQLIFDARSARQEACDWIKDVITALKAKEAALQKGAL